MDNSDGSAPEPASSTSEGGVGGELDLDADLDIDLEIDVIERAILNDSVEGRAIQAAFIDDFGAFMRETVRPILRDVASNGEQPQLLVNGLAELMRTVAESIEFPLDHPRSGYPPRTPESSGG